MRLADDTMLHKRDAVQQETGKQGPRWARWLMAAGAAALLALLLIFTEPDKQTPPVELVGTWQTDNSNYKNCALKIDLSSIVIEAADGNAYLYTVKSIDKVLQEDGKPLYAISSENGEGVEFTFWLRLDESPAGMALSFKNQPQLVWYKTR